MGASMNLASVYISIYYNVIIAYSLYFMFLSVRSNLLWSKCDPAWAGPNCMDDFTIVTCNGSNLIKDFTNGKCYSNVNSVNVSVGCKYNKKIQLFYF
jgi:hypothetical protein